MTDIGYGEGRRLFAQGTVCTKEEDKTRQSDYAASDINKIVKRFDFEEINREMYARLDRGELPWLGEDVSTAESYVQVWQRLAEADQYFGKLPPEIRSKFDNDVKKFLDAYEQQKQREVFEEIGLIEKAPPAPAAPVAPPPG